MHGLTYNVLKLMMEADPALFEACSGDTAERAPQVDLDPAPDARQEAKRKWALLRSQFP